MDFVEMLMSSMVLIGLVLTWKDTNARWMFTLLLIFQLIDIITNPIAMQWTRHYYLWCLLLNVCFLFLILTRGILAELLFKVTKLQFFKHAKKAYSLTIPECAYCLMIFISAFLDISIWIEIQLYYYDILEYPFIYHHVWSPVQRAIHILASLALVTFITKVKRSEGALVYEKN